MATEPGPFLSDTGLLPASDTGQSQEVPVQKRAVDSGQHHHVTVPVPVPLGQVPPH